MSLGDRGLSSFQNDLRRYRNSALIEDGGVGVFNSK